VPHTGVGQTNKRRRPERAAIALSHSILVIAYHILRNDVDFNDLGADLFAWMKTAKMSRPTRLRLQRARPFRVAIMRVTYDFLGKPPPLVRSYIEGLSESDVGAEYGRRSRI
jgi:hypothetical protein